LSRFIERTYERRHDYEDQPSLFDYTPRETR
jgi:hypothetical protein